jgi:hypothetical protein
MGASHTTDREKQLFQHLVSTGLSVHKVSRLTGRSHACITNNVDTTLVTTENQPLIWTDEDMHKIFDLHSAGKRVVDISREMNRPNQTVSSITRRVNSKHQRSYAKWLELQKEKDAPALVMEVQPVEPPALPAALLAIRAARAAGRTSQPATVEQVQPECVDFRSKYFALLEEHSRVMADYIKSLKAL